MHPDEGFLAALQAALDEVRLEAIVIGTVAAALQGAPILTVDVDLLIRDSQNNRAKVRELCERVGGTQLVVSPLSKTTRIVGLTNPVDLLFDQITPGLSFESLRSRAVHIPIGAVTVVAASLSDVIASKAATARPKDLAQLPILRDALRVISDLDSPAEPDPS